LIEHFLESWRRLNPTVSLALTSDFVTALAKIELPGNVRELENLVRQAVVNKDDNSPLSLSDLPFGVWRQLAEQRENPSSLSGDLTEGKMSTDFALKNPPPADPSYLAQLLHHHSWNLARSLHHCEKLFLEAALRRSQGNQSQTARLLGITPRSVYNMARKHQLRP
jgi:transcriptional regulator with GAF, ATPase, and Fis domain